MSKFLVIGGSTLLSPSRANPMSVKIHNLPEPGYKKTLLYSSIILKIKQ